MTRSASFAGPTDTMHTVAKAGFALQAIAYEAARPSYPAIAVNKILSLLNGEGSTSRQQSVRLLDLAAGTGKLTRLIAPHFHDVVAVEPVKPMREQFSQILPYVPILDGTADKIPLPDQSVDGLLVGQAFHWFANGKALEEMHRVLKPSAKLILIWNMEDNRQDWVAKLRAAYEKHELGTPQYRLGLWRDIWKSPVAAELFEPLREAQYSWVMQCTLETVWARVCSKSYVACLPESVRAELKVEVDAILETVAKCPNEVDPPNTTAKLVTYPHITDVVWTSRR